MKRLLALLFTLALTRFAWGDMVWVSMTSDTSDWIGSTAYVFASSEQATLEQLVSDWFGDNKITQSEIAQFESASSFVMSLDMNSSYITCSVEDMELPSTIDRSIEAVYAVILFVNESSATVSHTTIVENMCDGVGVELLLGDQTSALSANTVSVVATVLVTPTRVQQRYPWNGLVDIELYAAPNATLTLTAKNMTTGEALSVNTLTLDGESFVNGSTVLTKADVHLVWNAAADLEDGTSITNAGLRVSAEGPTKDLVKYMVIDVSGGPEATSYPVSYLYNVPDGGWTDEYKTTKIVLRHIYPGTFTMGSPGDELGRSSNGSETQHKVTLTSDYWIGVFEMTQAQYTNVVAVSNPSGYTGDMRPVEQLSYNTFLGDSGLVSNLVSRTGLAFTLPTDAQWEYACRAGTTTALYNGCNLTNRTTDANVALLARYSYNKTDGKGDSSYTQHTVVGSYLPNARGLYDMYGNVYELCLDLYVADLGSSEVTDPTGAESGSNCVMRGGSYVSPASGCRSAVRARNGLSSGSSNNVGFRLACRAN